MRKQAISHKIVIIDYGAGNLRSVVKAVAKLGYNAELTNNPHKVMAAHTVILPGVGAAGDTMDSLEHLDLVEPIRKVILDNRPFLGICVGLQVLLTSTEESGGYQCLGLIPGSVRLLPAGLKVPQMGWNQLKQKIEHPIFDGIPDRTNFYFVHSYHVNPDDHAIVAAETEYGFDLCAMIIHKNLIATQFHPEKSGWFGLKMLDNFLKFATSDNIQGTQLRKTYGVNQYINRNTA
ncbi:MAG: imidazole glycerol phosphate synthase subunit HisH [Chloroflexota bacterium]|nr:imidazole glycerol phosphate synthase subunit HisH [Chloroflexota bacterium]